MPQITDEQAANARRMRRRRYTWSQIAEHMRVPVTDLIRRVDRKEAVALGLIGSTRAAAVVERAPRAEREVAPLAAQRDGHVGRPSVRSELAALLFDIFDEMLFAEHAVFEKRASLKSEMRAALRRGQTITGFLMGDPMPGRSALDKSRRAHG